MEIDASVILSILPFDGKGGGNPTSSLPLPFLLRCILPFCVSYFILKTKYIDTILCSNLFAMTDGTAFA